MQTKPIKHLLIWPTAFGLWLLTSTFGLPAFAQGSSLGSFTYQGRLNDANGPASGLFDFQFSLYPASFGTNNQVGTSVSSSSLPVTNGLFTAALSFPMASTSFDGNDCWLEISVRPSLSGSTFVTLSPRQQITAAPYAMRAANAMAAAILTGVVPAGQISGTLPLAQLPASVVTNGANGLNLSGTFTGNGAGVTNINLLLNSGGVISPIGNFILTSSPGVGEGPVSVTSADVNGDGKPDLISANRGTFGGGNTLTVLTNNGSGGFGLAASLAVGSGPASVTAADVNGDGKADLISANTGFPDGNTLTVLMNTAVFNGAFIGKFSGNGAGLTGLSAAQIPGLDASKLISGTISDALLSANVALRNGGNAFTGYQTITGGNVGIGTTGPETALHVYSANSPTTIRVQSSGGFGAGRIEFLSDPQGGGTEWRPGYIQSTDNGGFIGGLSFVVNGAGFANRFAEIEVMGIVNGRVGIGTATPVSALQVVGTVTATAFNPPSDRNLKENFAPVSPRDVLEKVAGLPISRWNFKGDASTPHVGPMAQDFHAAFALGTDERHIATVDADGVALAAIQGLNQKLEESLRSKEEEIRKLKRRLERIEEQLARPRAN